MRYTAFFFFSLLLLSCNDPEPDVEISFPEQEWGEDIILGDTTTTDPPVIGLDDTGDID